jgi:FAD binding domain-containing protein
MIEKRPGLILRCPCIEDVVAAVNVARVYGFILSVRCRGHVVSGKALSDGGLTIDMGMRMVVVDVDRMLVHVDGGCRLGDIDEATARHGLIVPAGAIPIPSTGFVRTIPPSQSTSLWLASLDSGALASFIATRPWTDARDSVQLDRADP